MAQAAVKVASFPSYVKDVALELRRLISGKLDYSDVRATPSETEWSGFGPVASEPRNKVEGLIVRRGTGTPALGWRVLVGAFKIDGAVQNAALMLSPDLTIVHYWPLLEDGQMDAGILTATPPEAGLKGAKQVGYEGIDVGH